MPWLKNSQPRAFASATTSGWCWQSATERLTVPSTNRRWPLAILAAATPLALLFTTLTVPAFAAPAPVVDRHSL